MIALAAETGNPLHCVPSKVKTGLDIAVNPFMLTNVNQALLATPLMVSLLAP
jgi:hypothetical protein